jgi:hypothetical protein
MAIEHRNQRILVHHLGKLIVIFYAIEMIENSHHENHGKTFTITSNDTPALQTIANPSNKLGQQILQSYRK